MSNLAWDLHSRGKCRRIVVYGGRVLYIYILIYTIFFVPDSTRISFLGSEGPFIDLSICIIEVLSSYLWCSMNWSEISRGVDLSSGSYSEFSVYSLNVLLRGVKGCFKVNNHPFTRLPLAVYLWKKHKKPVVSFPTPPSPSFSKVVTKVRKWVKLQILNLDTYDKISVFLK